MKNDISIIEELEQKVVRMVHKSIQEVKGLRLSKGDKFSINIKIDLDDMSVKLLQYEVKDRESKHGDILEVKIRKLIDEHMKEESE